MYNTCLHCSEYGYQKKTVIKKSLINEKYLVTCAPKIIILKTTIHLLLFSDKTRHHNTSSCLCQNELIVLFKTAEKKLCLCNSFNIEEILRGHDKMFYVKIFTVVVAFFCLFSSFDIKKVGNKNSSYFLMIYVLS